MSTVHAHLCVSRKLAILAATLIGAAQSVSAGSVQVRAVAIDGDAAPGTSAVFTRLDSAAPVFNANGDVVFRGTLSGSGVTAMNDRGIWAEQFEILALVAREDDIAPDSNGARFHAFLDPQIGDDGRNAFRAFLRGPGVTSANGVGFWSGIPGDVRLVARQGEPAPDTVPDTNYSIFNQIFLSAASNAGFFSLLSGAAVDATNFRGIWSEEDGVLSLAARMGDPAPGTASGVVFDNFSAPLVNGLGQTAFRASLSGPGVDGTNSLGFWTGSAAGLQLVAREGAAAPGFGKDAIFASFANAQSDNIPAFNDISEVAFTGAAGGANIAPAEDRAIWVRSGGTTTLLVREGATAPETIDGALFADVFVSEIPGWPGDPFTIPTFTSLTLNGAGDTGFLAGLAGNGVTPLNDLGIFVGSEQAVDLVVRRGDTAAGTSADTRFAFFGFLPHQAISVNENGDVMFFGILVGPGVDFTNNSGIWAQDDAGALTLIARTGGSLAVAPDDTRTIAAISVLTGSGGEDGRDRAFNNAGQVVYGASFTDGTAGVFVASLCAADLNSDRVVNFAEVELLTDNLGCGGFGCGGDVDGDFDADVVDLALLQTRFGNVCQ